jgi:hypothetical protein
MEVRLSTCPPIERVAFIADVCHCWIVEVDILVFVLRCGGGNLVRRTAQVWQAVVRQILVWVSVLIIACGAVALIVVDQVLTRTGFTSRVRAIRNVLTPVYTRFCGLVRKTAVTVATKVVHVLACRILMVHACAVLFAIVLN